MLDGRISDTLEGRALSHALDKVRKRRTRSEKLSRWIFSPPPGDQMMMGRQWKGRADLPAWRFRRGSKRGGEEGERVLCKQLAISKCNMWAIYAWAIYSGAQSM